MVFQIIYGEIPPQADQPWAGAVNLYIMFYVYILKNIKDNKLYKGMTSDLKRRVKEHNFGKSTFTRHGGKWRLVYYEAFLSEADARREELFLKSGKGRERIKYLLQNA